MKKFLLFLSCIALFSCSKPTAPLALHWDFVRNDVEPRVSEARLTLTNTSGSTIAGGWKLYSCLESMTPLCEMSGELDIRQIQGSYHCYAPTPQFRPLPADSSRTFVLRFRGGAPRESIHPEGFFIVPDEGAGPVSVPCTYEPYTRREQMVRGIQMRDTTPYSDGEYLWNYNARQLSGTRHDVLPILPQPKHVEQGSGVCRLKQAVTMMYEVDRSGFPAEGYSIVFSPDTISVYAADKAGFFYARNTLGQLGDSTTVGEITDWPDMRHRGVMLDIVRNFYPLDSICRVLDVMADLKLNVLHLHLSDDEAWRVEIPGLPELTAQGARRGYTLDETECLYPMYNGGWDCYDKNSMANGFLTRDDFISLLKYADERCIRVIPEVDMPGHMRACKKALRPLLSDSLMDTRKYYGAQEYTDNVIAVTNPYALTFIETVVGEFSKMYAEAGCPFLIFNIGGDEVPEGALTDEEHQTFINGVLDILARYNLRPMGWEEITHFCKPSSRAICYSWHNGTELPLKMAEEGYEVVLASANRLYFDFAYCRHHEERGLEWGGFTDEFRSFDWEPLQHPNIIGLNAQLWAECLRSFAQVEWQLFPKMYGLSERAWNNRSSLSLADYTGLVYETMLPRLHAEGHNFHLHLPGVHMENVGGQRIVSMNKVMQGGEIIYTLDGSEWQTYSSPFALPADYDGVVKARVRYLDHTSTTTWSRIE